METEEEKEKRNIPIPFACVDLNTDESIFNTGQYKFLPQSAVEMENPEAIKRLQYSSQTFNEEKSLRFVDVHPTYKIEDEIWSLGKGINVDKLFVQKCIRSES